MDVSEFYIDYDERGNPVRTRWDLFSLRQFVKAQDSGGADEASSVRLFWEVWRPRSTPIGDTEERDIWGSYSKNPPPLSPEKETVLLEEIARLEGECWISYEPDVDLSSTLSQFNDASQYVHVGAASALRHLQRDGFSDYVRQTLIEVRRVLQALEIDNRLMVDADASGDYISLFGVMSLVLSALSRMKCIDGEYEQALLLASDVVMSSKAVSDALDVEREFLLEVFGQSRAKEEEDIRFLIREQFISNNLESQRVVDAFEGLRMQGESRSWSLVARVCRVLSLPFDDDLMWEMVSGADGREEPWLTYWHRAEGWAAGQLGQKDLRDFLKRQEEDASETRLIRYFFGETWGNIPEKAQGSLINVDVIWFSQARGARVDAVLNDLQVATETMCYAYIWEPLRQAKGGQELLEFKKRDNDLNQNHQFPNLSDYTWVCRQRFFKEFVQGFGLSEEDQLFLTAELESALDFLSRGRNPAQHDPNVWWRREDVERLVKLFLGIGQPGVLRRLAEIGPKLAGK